MHNNCFTGDTMQHFGLDTTESQLPHTEGPDAPPTQISSMPSMQMINSASYLISFAAQNDISLPSVIPPMPKVFFQPVIFVDF